MKNIIAFALFGISFSLTAQVAIDKSSVTPGTSLEFGDNQGKGLVLPYLTTVANSPAGYSAAAITEPGTIIMDLATKQVKILGANGWLNLSNNASTSNSIPTAIQDSKVELQGAKVSIGKIASPAVDGILVLEDNNKAMILPRESSYKNIKNPAPGMLVYDTTENLLCVYNGTEWAFWTGQ